MTVASETTRKTYAGDDSTTTFPITFTILAKADLVVILRDADGNEALEVLDSDYEINADLDTLEWIKGDPIVPPATGETLLLILDMSFLQEADAVENDPMPAATVEGVWDRLTMFSQILSERLDRSPHIKKSESLTDIEISDVTAGEYLRWNLAGDGIDSIAQVSDLGTFLQSGTGAVARTVAAKIGENLSVKDFGALGNGVKDDTVAIQATINACSAAGGGKVLFPRGIYLVSDTLSLPSYVTLQGECSMYNSYTTGSMLWLADNSDCDMIANSDSVNGNYNIRIRDLQLNGNRTNQASGSGIVFTKTYKCYLEDVYLNQIQDYGIYVNNTGGLIGNIFLTRVFTMNIFDHAVYLHDTSDAVIEGCELQASPTKYALYIADGGSHYISNTDMESSYIGCYINGGVNNRFSNCVFYSNEKQGLFIYDSRSNSVVGCHVIQNGQADANGNEEGILITDSDYNTITGNIVEDNQVSPTQKYGIREYGTSDYNTITGNVVRLNVTAQISVLGSNTTVKGNIPEGETVTVAAPTLQPWGYTKIDSTSNAVDGTLGSGQYVGQIKTIVMIEASNSSTISITNHQTTDPEVATFDAVDETGVFMWTGTEWITIFATCTFV